MYQLHRVDPTTFVLFAEGADLAFRPNLPDEFAIAAMDGGEARLRAAHRSDPDPLEQAPRAKPLTLVLFYLLVAGTIGMAAWALISFIG
ncbi:hypothetical protein BH23ACT4_BH23ACT4_05580 [soil metagenome]